MNRYAIFVDTCVWQHWFASIAGRSLPGHIQKQCECFGEIYQAVASSSRQAEFLFNFRIREELGSRFRSQFEEFVLPFARKVSIPLTRRHDGAYPYDGSILMGGKMGGTLDDLLRAGGRDHEQDIAMAANSLASGEALYKTAPRKREFDIEHMESALEASADLFLTNDVSTILAPLQKLSPHYSEEHAISLIHKIAVTPVEGSLS